MLLEILFHFTIYVEKQKMFPEIQFKLEDIYKHLDSMNSHVELITKVHYFLILNLKSLRMLINSFMLFYVQLYLQSHVLPLTTMLVVLRKQKNIVHNKTRRIVIVQIKTYNLIAFLNELMYFLCF